MHLVENYLSGYAMLAGFQKKKHISFFQQLVSRVGYCDNMQVCHRDLKLENTLLDGSQAPRLKICDFGYSKAVRMLYRVGGLLNATFGNATEMIISIHALKNGMIRVVQQSLLGSILSNMLLVLGCAFFTGGIVHYPKVQRFNQTAAIVSSGLLLMAIVGILFPAVLHFTHTELHFGMSELAPLRFNSYIMLVAYASYLFFQLKSHAKLYDSVEEERENNGEDSNEEEVPEITMWEAIAWLTILTLWLSILSGYLVDAIQGASDL